MAASIVWPYFIDIETVPIEDGNGVDERTWEIFAKKFYKEIHADPRSLETEEDFWFERAGMYAEFGKIVAIGIGIVDSSLTLRVKVLALHGPDAEKRMLAELRKVLEKAPKLCAHNGKDFDYPYLQRKYLIHDLDLPDILNTMGKKPWEILNEDTMEMWKFSQLKHYASLDAIANVFGIPSPKTDMDGSKVAELYYAKNEDGSLPWENIEKIARYCAGDIVTLANVWARMKRQSMFAADKILYVDEVKQTQTSLNL